MPRRLHNWNYRQVIDFFTFLKELPGSHEAWIKSGENGVPDKRVEVNFRHDSYPVKTLKTIIRLSGIDEKEWIRWGNS
jgi:hypothetical protein